ncbi:MAG: DUF2490 domain-containing protein [Flavobacteriaceae bacterium]|jgi:hypothetical protein|nr:DUF2490 domain-containing protein [Flavobacteriaceae bacterium]
MINNVSTLQKRIYALSLIIWLGMFQNPVLAQSQAESKYGSWFVFINQHRFNEKFTTLTDIQHRSWEYAQNFNQLLLRSTLNYRLNSEFQLGLGYGYIATDSSFENTPDEMNSSEHRIHEQLLFRKKFNKGVWINRYRLEQRFLSNDGDGYDLAHRARYMARVNYSLSPKFFLSAFDELFLNLDRPVFGQNRLYFGAGYQATPMLNVQLGFMKNHFSSANYDRILLTLWYNSDSF